MSNRTSIKKAIKVFYPSYEDTQLEDLLLELSEAVGGVDETARWRKIFLTLCHSPSWQIL